MYILALFFVILIVWISLFCFSKINAKSLLCKYNHELPKHKTNSVIYTVYRLKELKRNGLIKEGDLDECIFIIRILLASLIFFPIMMILLIVITLILFR